MGPGGGKRNEKSKHRGYSRKTIRYTIKIAFSLLPLFYLPFIYSHATCPECGH